MLLNQHSGDDAPQNYKVFDEVLKNQDDQILRFAFGEWRYTQLRLHYTSAAAHSIVLQLHLRHDFRNTIFKIKH